MSQKSIVHTANWYVFATVVTCAALPIHFSSPWQRLKTHVRVIRKQQTGNKLFIPILTFVEMRYTHTERERESLTMLHVVMLCPHRFHYSLNTVQFITYVISFGSLHLKLLLVYDDKTDFPRKTEEFYLTALSPLLIVKVTLPVSLRAA